MSLFRVCSWWFTQCTDIYGHYTAENMLLCSLRLITNDEECIVVASHVGSLNIFRPTCERTEEGNFTEYTQADLVLECKLNSPILGIVDGNFSSSSKRADNYNHLAVLHPLSVCVYRVSYAPGITECGTQSTLHLLVEHRLTKCSFSICKGKFGGGNGKDFVCVTHLDGSLTFFEQDGISYSCALAADTTVPFPLVYDSKSDAFLRVNSSWELESFSYKNISNSGYSVVNATWSLCIGEHPIQIMTVRESETSIMILGEYNLMSISDGGSILFIKKLDYVPICFHSFMNGWFWEPNSRLITAIISSEAKLFLYEMTSLIWVAQLETLPIAFLRANLSGLPGGILVLSSNGLLHIGFLGSEPYMLQIPQLSGQRIDFENTSKELADLEHEIKRGIDVTDIRVNNTLASKDIEVDVDISRKLQKYPLEISDRLTNLEVRMCTATLNCKANTGLDQVQITFSTDEVICCTSRITACTYVGCGSVKKFEISFYILEKINISSTKLEVIVSFINKHCTPRVITKNYFLPPLLFYSIPKKQSLSADKVAVELNLIGSVPGFKLSNIFVEYDQHDKCNGADAQLISVYEMFTLNTVELLAIENKYNYRIQSNCAEALAPVLELVVSYLRDSKADDNHSCRMNKIVCKSIFSIDELKKRIVYYHEIQQEIKERTRTKCPTCVNRTCALLT